MMEVFHVKLIIVVKTLCEYSTMQLKPYQISIMPHVNCIFNFQVFRELLNLKIKQNRSQLLCQILPW